MKILFDHQTFSLQEYGGISRYFGELISGINSLTNHDAYLSLLFTNNVYAHDMCLARNHFLRKIEFSKKTSTIYRLNEIISTVDLLTKNYDLVHATYYNPYFLNLAKNKPKVVTFLDMIHERFKNQFNELSADKLITTQKKMVADRATHIIAISESTKNDIVELLDINPDKVSVIYLGSSFKNVDQNKIHQVYKSSTPYILFVGNRGHYKNFNFFIESLTPILLRYEVRVICAGGGSFTKEEYNHINALGLKHIVTQEMINDQKLKRLYREAILFAFPSLYEGFGIPILEAFSCNCPCAVSNQSSLPEVAGNAAVYFSPTDTDSIRNCIDRLLSDEMLRMDLIHKGRQQLSKFSWDKTVQDTVHVYEKIV